MRRRAFTLIEMMIAIATVVILTAVAIPNFVAYRDSSHVSVCKSNINAIVHACEMHYLTTGHVVTDIGSLCSKTKSGCYIRSVPVCPLGGTYIAIFDSGMQKFKVSCSAFDEDKHNVVQGSDD